MKHGSNGMPSSGQTTETMQARSSHGHYQHTVCIHVVCSKHKQGYSTDLAQQTTEQCLYIPCRGDAMAAG